jgi:UDP-N-acetylmuramyl pentapeptide synthase
LEYIEKKKNTGPVLFWTDDYEKLESKLLEVLKKGDLLLLKGSRSMNLERLVGPVSGLGRGERC